jgi:hypothetical protein
LLNNGYNRDVTQASYYLAQNQKLDNQNYNNQLGYLNNNYGFIDRTYNNAVQAAMNARTVGLSQQDINDLQSWENLRNGLNSANLTYDRAGVAYRAGNNALGTQDARSLLNYNTGLRGVDIEGQQSNLSNNERLASLLTDATSRGSVLSQGYGDNVGYSNQQLGVENANQGNERDKISGTRNIDVTDIGNQRGTLQSTYNLAGTELSNSKTSLQDAYDVAKRQTGLNRQDILMNYGTTVGKAAISRDTSDNSLDSQISGMYYQQDKSNLDYSKQSDYIKSIAQDYGIRQDQAHNTLNRGLQALGMDMSTTVKQLTDAQNSRNASQAAQAASLIQQAMQTGMQMSSLYPNQAGTPIPMSASGKVTAGSGGYVNDHTNLMGAGLTGQSYLGNTPKPIAYGTVHG